MKYDFNIFGNMMSFNMKILKHMNAGNEQRVKDYICVAYDTFNPEDFEYHPSIELIKDAFQRVLEPKGWRITVTDWKDQGKQVILISPQGEYYRSHFNHNS